MEPATLNTKPFWSLIILLFVDLVWRIALLVTIFNFRQFAGHINITPVILQLLISFAVLLAEAVMYWKLRRRFSNMLWVWCHISLLYFILLIMPFAYLMLMPILNRYIEPVHYSDLMETLSWVRLILFWSLLVVAHIFFVLTIVKGYSKKNEFEIDLNGASNLLDEFPG
jgi:hypothetical protein